MVDDMRWFKGCKLWCCTRLNSRWIQTVSVLDSKVIMIGESILIIGNVLISMFVIIKRELMLIIYAVAGSLQSSLNVLASRLILTLKLLSIAVFTLIIGKLYAMIVELADVVIKWRESFMVDGTQKNSRYIRFWIKTGACMCTHDTWQYDVMQTTMVL